MQNGTSAKAPPPPPSERRPARRRSSAEAMLKRLDRSPSPTIASPSIANQPPVAMLGTTTTVTKGKASRLSRGKAEKARSEAGDADGLDGFGTSLQAELGNERGRWQDMIVQGDPTPIKDGANQVSQAQSSSWGTSLELTGIREDGITAAGSIGFRRTRRSTRICPKTHYSAETSRSDVTIDIVPNAEQTVEKIYSCARNGRCIRKGSRYGRSDTTAYRRHAHDTSESRDERTSVKEAQQCGEQGHENERKPGPRRHQ